MTTNTREIDKLVRITLIAAIIAWSFQLVYPLLGIFAWAFILAVVLYPFYGWLNRLIGNRPIWASVIITLCVLFLLLSITIFITSDVFRTLSNFTTQIQTNKDILPKPPEVIQTWPVIGQPLHQAWTALSSNLKGTIIQYSNTLLYTGKYALAKVVNTSKDLVLFFVSIIFSGFLMIKAESFMVVIHKFAKRVADERGTNLINIIRDTIQNVSRGVIGIALLQTVIFWLLLLISGTPGSGLLSLLALILSIVQIGLFLLIIPLIVWLFFTKSLVFASIISLFLILDSVIDSFLKPLVLARGLSTPMIVILIGVIGGILVYGLIGIFIGPIVLAITYDLLNQWAGISTSRTASNEVNNA